MSDTTERPAADLGATHIALPVKDLDRSIDFYERYASMQVVQRRVDPPHGRGVAWLSDLTRPFVVVLITVAEVNAQRAHYAKQRLCAIPGIRPAFDAPVFNEFVLRTPVAPEDLNVRLRQHGILGGLALHRWYPELADGWLVCVTEARTRAEIDKFVAAVSEVVS